MTFEEFIADLNLEIFPDRLAENLVPAVRAYYKEVLTDLQRAVPKCLQVNHVDVFPFRSTYFKCGMSVLCAPAGKIKRVYTLRTDEWCEPVQYPRTNWDRMYCWSRSFNRLSGNPSNTGLPELALGFKYPEDSTDQNYSRALRGYFAYHDKNIYVAPWIQSTESIIVEWDGLKLTWNDADTVSSGNMDQGVWRRAIKAWVLAQKALYFDQDLRQSEAYTKAFEDAVSLMIHDCRLITENLDLQYACASDAPNVALAEAEAAASASDSASSTEETATVLAVIGDYGLAGTPESDVAELVKSWSPEAVLTTGDNNYPDGLSGTIDANIGQYYRKFIYPYNGSYPLLSGETDATTNRFWPVIGNHDIIVPFPPEPYFDYFSALNNKRNYTVVLGLCEMFMVNSGINTAGVLVEPLGNTAVSIAGAWLQAKLAASVAKFKFVFWHHPGYSSDISYYPGVTAMRSLTNAIKAWGADALFNGHGHQLEYIDHDGLPIFVNGAGGAALRATNTPPVDGSEFRYSANYGAIKLTVTCTEALVQFYNIDGTKLYEVSITNNNPVLQSA